MKTYFELSLNGRDWWKPWLVFWFLFLLLYVPLLVLQGRSSPPRSSVGAYLAIQLVFILVMTLLSAVFTVVFLRILLPRLSIAGEAFAFRGSIGELLKIYLVGFLLSVVTLGIYLPWYTRRITAYLVSQTAYKGVSLEFLGRGGRLFKYFLLALLLPLVAVVALVTAVAVAARGFGSGAAAASGIAALVSILILLLMVPFMYLCYKWYVNVRWNDVTIAWHTSFWPSVFFLLGQIALTVITVGIYAPAAILRAYGYFSARTVLNGPNGEAGRLGFEGPLGKGFGLIWGQTLLTLVTAGIYAPWAYANVGRWMMKATYHEGAPAAAT